MIINLLDKKNYNNQQFHHPNAITLLTQSHCIYRFSIYAMVSFPERKFKTVTVVSG